MKVNKSEVKRILKDVAPARLVAATKYVDVNETVAILNSFPIFIFEYVK